MLDFLNCTPQNKLLLTELFLGIFTDPEFSEPDLKNKIKLIYENQSLAPDKQIELTFSIIYSVCQLESAYFEQFNYLNSFENSSLFKFLKKLFDSKLLDIDIFLAILNETFITNFEEILNIFSKSDQITVDKSMIMSISHVLMTFASDGLPSSYYYLELLQRLLTLHFSAADIYHILSVTNPKTLMPIVINISETNILNVRDSEKYLRQFLNSELVDIYSEIITLGALFITQEIYKSEFFMGLLKPQLSNQEGLKKLLFCLNASRPFLRDQLILKYIKHENIHQIHEVISEITKIETISLTIEIIEFLFDMPMGIIDTSLIAKFIRLSHQAHLFSDENTSNENLTTILKNFVLNQTRIRVFINLPLFNGNHDQIKFNLLFGINSSSNPNHELNEAIQDLERNDLLAYFEDYNFLYQNTSFKITTNALIILKNEKILNLFNYKEIFKLLSKHNSPCEYARAMVELHKNPIFYSDKQKVLVTPKDILTSDVINLLEILRILSSYNLLTKEALDKLKRINIDDNVFLAKLHETLQSGFLKKNEIEVLLNSIFDTGYYNPLNIVSAIFKLIKTNRFSPEFITQHFQEILTHSNPHDLCEAFILLEKSTLTKEKIEFYRKACLSYGVDIKEFGHDPEECSIEELKQIKTSYIIFDDDIFFTRDGNLLELRRSLDDDDLNQAFPPNKLIITDDTILDKFIKITNIESQHTSCTNYVKCMLILEEQEFLTPWFEQTLLPEILNHKNPFVLAEGLNLLNQLGLFSESNQKFIQALIQHSNPAKLSLALNYIKMNQMLSFDDALVDQVLKHPSPYDLIKAIHELINSGIFRNEIFQDYIPGFLSHEKPLDFAQGLISLQQAKVLDEILATKELEFLFKIDLNLLNSSIIQLKNLKLYNNENLAQLKKLFLETSKLYDPQQKNVFMMLNKILHLPFGFIDLKPEIFDAIHFFGLFKDNIQPQLVDKYLATIVNLLKPEEYSPFRQDILHTFLKNFSKADILIKNLVIIQKHNLLNQANFKTLQHLIPIGLGIKDEIKPLLEFLLQLNYNLETCVNKISASWVLAEILEQLTHDKGSLENYAIIVRTLLQNNLMIQTPTIFLNHVNILKRSRLLNEDNLKSICHMNDNLTTILDVFQKNNLLNYPVLRFLIRFQRIFDNFDIAVVFFQIPVGRITAEHLEIIKRICIRNLLMGINPMNDIIDFLRHAVIGIPRPPVRINLHPDELNASQSTHAASVHKTVSESIIRLKLRYEAQLTEEQILIHLKEIHEFLFALESTHKYDAAKRYWNLISRHQSFMDFKDPASGINIRQLLFIFWTAIQDFSTRIHDETESKEVIVYTGKVLLAQAFYEASRDGNINGDGIDDLEPIDKKPSCASGFINKLIEKLVGIHPDVQIIMITNEIVGEKFKAIVCEHAIKLTRLKIQAKKQTDEQLDDDIIDNAVLKAWPEIRENVIIDFFKEFQEFFKNDQKNPNFLAYLELGEDVTLPSRHVQMLHKLNKEKSRKREAEATDEIERANISSQGLFSSNEEKKQEKEQEEQNTHKKKRA